ncbi:MAG: hypothetical protein WCF19_07530 [Chlamydiales bacterium]
MATSTKFTNAEILIYRSLLQKDGCYGTDPGLVDENIVRLTNDFHVEPGRINVISDSHSLEQELRLRQKKILILPGGYTPFLAEDLKCIYPLIVNAVESGFLNVLGQCAGANIMCDQFSNLSKNGINKHNITQLSLLPLVANTAVYPIETDKMLGELANRKIVSLQSNENQKFMSLWHRGSRFEYTPTSKARDMVRLIPMAYYNSPVVRDPKELKEKWMAAAYGIYPSGAKAVVVGPHIEVVEAEVPPAQVEACKSLRTDTGRHNLLKNIFELLGVISQPPPSKIHIDVHGIQHKIIFSQKINKSTISITRNKHNIHALAPNTTKSIIPAIVPSPNRRNYGYYEQGRQTIYRIIKNASKICKLKF